MRKFGLRRKSITEQAKAEDKLDKAFSSLIRTHYLSTGECATCGRPIFDIKEADCGHFRRRECMNTRYNPRNAALQCRKCNRFEGGRTYEMGRFLDKVWGTGTAEKMEKESRKIKNWDVKDLQFLTDATQGWLTYLHAYDSLSTGQKEESVVI